MVEPIYAKGDITINTDKSSDRPVVACKGNFDNIIVNFKRHMVSWIQHWIQPLYTTHQTSKIMYKTVEKICCSCDNKLSLVWKIFAVSCVVCEVLNYYKLLLFFLSCVELLAILPKSQQDRISMSLLIICAGNVRYCSNLLIYWGRLANLWLMYACETLLYGIGVWPSKKHYCELYL